MKPDDAWDLFIGLVNAWEVGYGTSLIAHYYLPRQASRGQIADILLRVIPTLPTDMINYEIMPFIAQRQPILPPTYESVSSMAAALATFNAPIITRPTFDGKNDNIKFLSMGMLKIVYKFLGAMGPSVLLRAVDAPNDYMAIIMLRMLNDLATLYAIGYHIK